MWSYGLSLFAGKGSRNIWKKVITHSCIISVFIGLVLMFCGSYGYILPSSINDALKAVASCNKALSMIAAGGILSEVSFRSVFDGDAMIYSLIRLFGLPLFILLLLRLFHTAVLPANVCFLPCRQQVRQPCLQKSMMETVFLHQKLCLYQHLAL